MNNSETTNPNMLENSETTASPVSLTSNKWLKAGLFGLAGLLVTVSLVYAGYWYGTKSEKLKSQSLKPQLKTENSTPTVPPMVTSQPTLPSEPTISPAETAKWKSYTDSTYHFTFSYPEEWKFDPCADVLCGSFRDLSSDSLIMQISGFGADCGVLPFASFTNAEKAAMCGCEAQGMGVAVSCDSPSQEQIITINNETAGYYFLLRQLTNGEPRDMRGPYTTFFFPKPISGQGVLNEYGLYFEVLDKNIIPVFNQILSTFRFLE